MYERFTDRARKVMRLANEEAQRRNCEYIGAEHILLGLLKADRGVAIAALLNLGVTPRTIIAEVEKLAPGGKSAGPAYKPPLTPATKRVIEYAMNEACGLKHDYVGTEHILLGLLREEDGVAAAILESLDVRLDWVRAEILAILRFTRDAYAPPSSDCRLTGWEHGAPFHLPHFDEDTKRRIRELAHGIPTLQAELEKAVASQEFSKAVELRNRRRLLQQELDLLNLPEYVVQNVNRLMNSLPEGLTRHPLLEMFDEEVGEADAKVLSALPKPLLPPLKMLVRCVPRFPSSTLRAALAPDDICSPFFQVLVPLLSPESVARRKGNRVEMTRCVFSEIVRAQSPIFGRAAVLCVVCPSQLSPEVRHEVLAGLHRADCDFVVFETSDNTQSLLDQLPAGTKRLDV